MKKLSIKLHVQAPTKARSGCTSSTTGVCGINYRGS
jgi:hypothetical protein